EGRRPKRSGHPKPNRLHERLTLCKMLRDRSHSGIAVAAPRRSRGGRPSLDTRQCLSNCQMAATLRYSATCLPSVARGKQEPLPRGRTDEELTTMRRPTCGEENA